MKRQLFSFITLSSALGAWGTALAADEASNWITMAQAVQIAQDAVAGTDTPIKAELDAPDSGIGPITWEIKTYTGTPGSGNATLWEVNINPETGAVVNVDDSDGGGAQDKVDEANSILTQSVYTLQQAIAQAGVLWPEFFATELDMEFRNGVAIFDFDLIRGAYKLETWIRASDGAVIRERTRLLSNSSDLYNANIPDNLPGTTIDTTGYLTAQQIIAVAQSQFAGSKAFEVELDQVTGTTYRYEIRLLQGGSGGAVVKAKYHPVSGTLLSSKVLNDANYVANVQAGVNSVTATLNQAIAAAKNVTPGGFVIEAELKYSSNSLLYNIELQTGAGNVEVKVNSTTGAVTSFEFED